MLFKRQKEVMIKRLGFFRELPYGDLDGPSLHEHISATPHPDEPAILSYLENGIKMPFCNRLLQDVLDDSVDFFAEGPLMISDGEWAWFSDLSYYVRKYHVRLPDAFIQYAVHQGWHIPKITVEKCDKLTEWSKTFRTTQRGYLISEFSTPLLRYRAAHIHRYSDDEVMADFLGHPFSLNAQTASHDALGVGCTICYFRSKLTEAMLRFAIEIMRCMGVETLKDFWQYGQYCIEADRHQESYRSFDGYALWFFREQLPLHDNMISRLLQEER